MSYEYRYDFIMYNELNDYNDYNNIEFRDTIINNNEIKDFIDLDDLIDSFNKMHI